MLEREARNLEDKVKSGIIHCANYVCNGCPYALSYEEKENYENASAIYVRCMQKLIDDIYNEMKEVGEND